MRRLLVEDLEAERDRRAGLEHGLELAHEEDEVAGGHAALEPRPRTEAARGRGGPPADRGEAHPVDDVDRLVEVGGVDDARLGGAGLVAR